MSQLRRFQQVSREGSSNEGVRLLGAVALIISSFTRLQAWSMRLVTPLIERVFPPGQYRHSRDEDRHQDSEEQIVITGDEMFQRIMNPDEENADGSSEDYIPDDARSSVADLQDVFLAQSDDAIWYL